MLKEFFATEVSLSMILGLIILFIAYKYRAKILSPRGKEILKSDISILKIGVAMSILSLFVFLIAESADILMGLAPGYDWAKISESGEVLHMFFTVIALVAFVYALNRVRRTA